MESPNGPYSTARTDISDYLLNESTLTEALLYTESDPVQDAPETPTWLIPYVVIRAVVLFITFWANVLVLYAYATTKRLRTYTNYYVVGLAVADLVSGGVMPVLGFLKDYNENWLFGEAFCTCATYLDHIFLQATFMMTLVICYDRFRATNMPLKHLSEKTLGHACFLIFLGYFIPVLLWTPVIIILPYTGVISRVQPPLCHGPYAFYPSLLTFTVLTLSWAPMSVAVVLYAFVYCAIIRKGVDKSRGPGKATILGDNQKRKALPKELSLASYRSDAELPERIGVSELRDAEPVTSVLSVSAAVSLGMTNPAFEVSAEDDHTGQAPKNPKSSGTTRRRATPSAGPRHHRDRPGHSVRSGKSSKRESRLATRRATRTLTFVFTTMIVSAMPWSVFALWAAVDPVSLPLSITNIFKVLAWMSHLSSTVNPFCYAVANPLFKEAFLRILRCRKNTMSRSTGRFSDVTSRSSNSVK
ncbi:muscarinic acetylcholine receptor M5-like [Acanthaster planci]|uniref:Muscarinic acetylcholine receptor M5-like n=1 Tax=Acanthaster planci TaxID=133434 RepID=A0A8B7ZF59_ACAPL|nr:muscarinic acetylcholine receptor M5-like [Acanthaster planci]